MPWVHHPHPASDGSGLVKSSSSWRLSHQFPNFHDHHHFTVISFYYSTCPLAQNWNQNWTQLLVLAFTFIFITFIFTISLMMSLSWRLVSSFVVSWLFIVIRCRVPVTIRIIISFVSFCPFFISLCYMYIYVYISVYMGDLNI